MSEPGREKREEKDLSADELESLRLSYRAVEPLLYNERLLRKKQEAALSNANRELAAQVTQLEKAGEDARASRRAALNLMEDAIASKEALRESEEKLARELEDTRQLQQISNYIIEEGDIESSYDVLLDSVMKLMHSDFASLQLLIPEKNELLLLAHKNFHPGSAEFWKYVNADSTSSCGLALANKTRVIIENIEQAPFKMDKGDYDAYKLSGITAMQSTPLISRTGKQVGMMSTHWKTPHKASERELGLYDIVARQVADLMERKKAEEALRASEEKYRIRLQQEVLERTAELKQSQELLQATLDNKVEMIQVFKAVRNEQGKIVDFIWILNNATSEQIYGDVIGKSLLENNPGVISEGIFDHFVSVVETGIPKQYEKHYVHEQFDGWFHQSVVKLDDGVATTTVNITERKRAEEDRFRNYLLLQQSEDLAALGSWDYDLATKSFTWSDGMYRLFDLEKGTEIKPEIYLEYTTDNDWAAAERVVQHIRHGDTDFEETLELTVSGKIKILHLKAAVVRNNQGRAERVLGVDMDISAIRAAEETIRKMEAAQQLEIFRLTLRTQEEERRRISESLHNGLGQILYGVKMSLSQLSVERALENPEEYEISRRYTSDLLSDAIRDSRRISHELMPAVLEEFGLRAAVKDICQQMQDGVKFRCSIEENDGEVDKYMQLAVFRTLQELMLNVVKHAEATKAEAKIQFDNGHILLRVSDNGRGIDPEKQGRDGIGLASIRSKVDLLNGSVDVKSAPGKGTSVTVRLPYITRK